MDAIQYVENQNIFNKIIDNIINKNTNSQAYILYCNSKEELKKCALVLSKTIICPNKYRIDCNLCNICKRIDHGEFNELLILDTPNLVIKKEEVLKIKNTFQKEPIEAKNQVYIIHDVEKLNASAANSLLKFIEEPDSRTVAIFTTTNLNLVLKTIISRCQIIKLNNKEKEYNIYDISELSKDEIDIVLNLIEEIELNYDYALCNLKSKFIDKFTDRNKFNEAISVFLYVYMDFLNNTLFKKIVYFKNDEFKLLNSKVNQSQDIIIKKISLLLDSVEELKYNINMLLFLTNLILRIGEINDGKSSRN